jgi:DNA-directed RNA polymerase subunit H (RpoH/RPB5)
MIPINNRIAQSFAVVQEMLRDRNILDEGALQELYAYGYNEIVTLARNENKIISIDIGKNDVRIIYFKKKVSQSDIKSAIDKVPVCNLAIVITPDKMTTNNYNKLLSGQNGKTKDTKKTPVDDVGENDPKVRLAPDQGLQIFQLSELMFNITKHELVPHHEVIHKKEDIDGLVKKFCLKSVHQFPLILRTDPVARYFGLLPGNVVRITRVSPSAGEYVMYRCCV